MIIKEKVFKMRLFLAKTFICSALNTSLISCVMIPYTKFLGMLPLQISIIITIKRAIRIVGDIIFGLIFDRFGAKLVFIIGRAMKLLCYLILLKTQSFTLICVSMVMYGLAEGTIQGKISSFIYNNLKANDKLSFFPKAMSLYYLFIDGHLALMKFLTGLLLKEYGYNLIIKISIVMNIISMIMLFFMIPNNKQNNLQQFVSKSFFDIFDKIKLIIKQNKIIMYIIVVYGILVFFAWQFGSIASMVMLDMGISATNITWFGGIINICSIIGTIISFLFLKEAIKIQNVCSIIVVILLFGIISAISYNVYLFCIFMIVVDIMYVMLEVSIEKNLEKFSDKHIRGTAISLALVCTNLIATFANLFIGFIAQHLSYKVGIICIIMVLFLVLIYFSLKIYKINTNISD